MQEQLKAILPHIQNIALALGVLFVAYLLTIPLRRRYASCDGVESQRRSGRQFLGVLLSYPAFSVVVLLLSLPAIYWLYRPWFYHPRERPTYSSSGLRSGMAAVLGPLRHCETCRGPVGRGLRPDGAGLPAQPAHSRPAASGDHDGHRLHADPVSSWSTRSACC